MLSVHRIHVHKCLLSKDLGKSLTVSELRERKLHSEVDHTSGEYSQQGKYFQWILKIKFGLFLQKVKQAFAVITECSVDILHIVNLKSQGKLRK